MSPLQFQRARDWPDRLWAWYEEARRQPFAWGAHDCVLAAADAVLRITGTDPVADLRGRWATEAEARQVLEQLGGLQAAAIGRLGPPQPRALVRRGDVVLVQAGQLGAQPLESLGICMGDTLVAPAEKGLASLPMRFAALGWRVGA